GSRHAGVLDVEIEPGQPHAIDDPVRALLDDARLSCVEPLLDPQAARIEQQVAILGRDLPAHPGDTNLDRLGHPDLRRDYLARDRRNQGPQLPLPRRTTALLAKPKIRFWKRDRGHSSRGRRLAPD